VIPRNHGGSRAAGGKEIQGSACAERGGQSSQS
jgi:hypothetical protein